MCEDQHTHAAWSFSFPFRQIPNRETVDGWMAKVCVPERLHCDHLAVARARSDVCVEYLSTSITHEAGLVQSSMPGKAGVTTLGWAHLRGRPDPGGRFPSLPTRWIVLVLLLGFAELWCVALVGCIHQCRIRCLECCPGQCSICRRTIRGWHLV